MNALRGQLYTTRRPRGIEPIMNELKHDNEMLTAQNTALKGLLKDNEKYVTHARATLRRDSYIQSLLAEIDRLNQTAEKHPSELGSAYLRGSMSADTDIKRLEATIADQKATIATQAKTIAEQAKIIEARSDDFDATMHFVF